MQGPSLGKKLTVPLVLAVTIVTGSVLAGSCDDSIPKPEPTVDARAGDAGPSDGAGPDLPLV